MLEQHRSVWALFIVVLDVTKWTAFYIVLDVVSTGEPALPVTRLLVVGALAMAYIWGIYESRTYLDRIAQNTLAEQLAPRAVALLDSW